MSYLRIVAAMHLKFLYELLIATFTNYVTLIRSWMIYQLAANVYQSQLFSQSCWWCRVCIFYLMQTPFSSQAIWWSLLFQSTRISYDCSAKNLLISNKILIFYHSLWSVVDSSIGRRANLKTRSFFVDFSYFMYTSWFWMIPWKFND